MRQRSAPRNGRRVHVAAIALLGGVLAVALAACSDLTSLSQDAPSQSFFSIAS